MTVAIIGPWQTAKTLCERANYASMRLMSEKECFRSAFLTHIKNVALAHITKLVCQVIGDTPMCTVASDSMFHHGQSNKRDRRV
jgi:hypothetical protein